MGVDYAEYRIVGLVFSGLWCGVAFARGHVVWGILMRVLVCGVVAALAVGLGGFGGLAVAAPADQSAPAATGHDYHPLTPVRVLDTRTSQGGGPVGAGETRWADLTGQLAGAAEAVVLNVTVTDVTATTYVTATAETNSPNWTPTSSNLNLVAGQTRANLVTVGTLAGMVDFYNHAGSVDIIADLEGYYTVGSGSEFTPVTPTRALDSRASGSFGANASQQLSLAGVVPANATAVTLNVTGLDATQGTYLTVWPAGGTMPSVSNLNLDPGQTVPNQVLVGLGTNAGIDIYNHVGTTDVLVDVTGYYTGATAASFTHLDSEVSGPPRVLDTRAGTGATGPVGSNSHITLDLAGVVPPTTTAVVLNVTGVDVTDNTYVTVWPDGGGQPGVSSLNLAPGETAANLVTVGISSSGKVDLYNHVGTIDLVADLAGYFAPPSTPCSSGCVSGWGSDVLGLVGDRHEPSFALTQTPLFGLTGVTSVASDGSASVYALRADGTVWTWGWGSDHVVRAAPTQVVGITDATAISAAGSGGFALKPDGTVWSFGDVAAITGSVGTAPTQVSGLSGVTAIASGADDLYALTGNGTVMAVGQNSYGQLGNGTTCSCASGPVQVSGLAGITQVSGGFLDGFALRSDGTVWSWGYNANGLNTGTDSGSSRTPLQVTGLSGVTAIATGNSTSVDTDISRIRRDRLCAALGRDGVVMGL